MRILILGGDGYLGWPTAMHFSYEGDRVMVVDNFSKRQIEMNFGIEPLEPIATLHRRVALWREITGREIILKAGSLLNHRFIYKIMDEFQPDAVIHYAEQPSAPYSMWDREGAVFTQYNNVIGTLNLLFALKKHCPEAHLVKSGSMGEYGCPNIDIEEGYLTIEHHGRTDTLPFPKSPGSFYDLSKVHDSYNIMFACKNWGLRATDLNQGVVYGLETDHTRLHPELRTSFHYDDIFGTVLNRFCVQAVAGMPLSVYGQGGQTRGFLNLRDNIKCVELAVESPASLGECRVFNQFTEVFSVRQLAEMVRDAARKKGMNTALQHLENPRSEPEEHYYNPRHVKLQELGLKPHLLSEAVIGEMLDYISRAASRINREVILPRIKWRQDSGIGRPSTPGVPPDAAGV
ncbi:MAG: NAD-dependent epimerase/dehydratase family protein [Deltaproteobacteria bacterium]|nr:MAG: NAD-dependent epimerase/dehydratase family protein [Deltaproteobacteria bacterium]